MSIQTVSKNRCFEGTQGIYVHESDVTSTPMRFSVYEPPQAEQEPVPVLWYLSGLTCTEENFTFKAGAQKFAAKHGVMIIAPDTSPRGASIEGEDESYDFGTGAGFYLDATVDPWSKNYQMYSYITEELQQLVMAHLPARADSQAITGHSMGGHGALTIGLKNPGLYKSISAFSPICAPSQCPWGQKALTGYLGDNKKSWNEYDATALIEAGRRTSRILIDQGGADEFLEKELMPHLFVNACNKAGQEVELRIHEGYDHSYYFIASFMEDHIRFHANALKS